MADFVPSVPKVAINVHPRFSFAQSGVLCVNICPRSSLILRRISGLLLGQISISISPNSTRSSFKYLKNGKSHSIGSS